MLSPSTYTLNVQHFRRDYDTEFSVHISLNGFRQLYHFFARGMVYIDENQRLQSVHTRASHAASLPSTLLNEPSSRDLSPFFQGIMRHIGIQLQQFREFL